MDACTPEGGGDLTIILQNFIYYLQIFLDNKNKKFGILDLDLSREEEEEEEFFNHCL